MVFLRFQERFVSLVGGVVLHASLEREEESPHVVEAVQLVEDGDVVDLAFAFVCWLAWRERVVLRVRDEHEAVAGRREVVAPGFVCFGR